MWDTLGTNLQNVTKDISKWNLDPTGSQTKFAGRNTEQKEVQHEEHTQTLEEMHEEQGGAWARDLDPDTFKAFLAKHDAAFVDHFAPWCIWCQRLAPTWEKFAKELGERELDVGVGKVDCVAHAQLCKDERVMAFPTLRWYEKGVAKSPDYRMDRTVEKLVEYAEAKIKAMGGGVRERRAAEAKGAGEAEHHPGCMVAGTLVVNRVPGKLHIEAGSVNHELHAAMTNLTHRVNHFTFGQATSKSALPLANLLGLKHLNPMKDKLFTIDKFHQVFHHDLKVSKWICNVQRENVSSHRGCSSFSKYCSRLPT